MQGGEGRGFIRRRLRGTEGVPPITTPPLHSTLPKSHLVVLLEDLAEALLVDLEVFLEGEARWKKRKSMKGKRERRRTRGEEEIREALKKD